MFEKTKRIERTKGRRDTSRSQSRRSSISEIQSSAANNRKNSLLVEANSLEELRANIRKEQLDAMKAEFSETKAKLEMDNKKLEEQKAQFKRRQEEFEAEQAKSRRQHMIQLEAQRTLL